jgi:glutathione S-transferase
MSNNALFIDYMLKLYEFTPSGNCYKVRLLLTQLHISFKRIEIDITQGESDTPAFLKKNPNGRVPVLEIKEGQYISESNAILFYLAHNTFLLPPDKLIQAEILQWLFFEQYSHEPNIATPRYWVSILGEEKKYLKEIEVKKKGWIPGSKSYGIPSIKI